MEIEKANIEELKKMQKDISTNMEKSEEEIKKFFEELPTIRKKKEIENNIRNILGEWDKDTLEFRLDKVHSYIKKEFIEYTKDKNLEDKELNQYRLDLEKTRETWYWDFSSEEEEDREEEKEEVKKKEEEKVVTVKTKPRKSVLEEALEATIKEKEKLLKEQQEKDKEELEKSTNRDQEIKKGNNEDYEY